MAGEPEGARAADRSEPAFLRIGAAARPSRARASRARLLHGRHQELRARADLPDARPATSRSARSRRRSPATSRRPTTSSSSCRRRASARPTAGAGIRARPAAAAARRRPRSMPAAPRRRPGPRPAGLRMRSGEGAGDGCGTRGLLLSPPCRIRELELPGERSRHAEAEPEGGDHRPRDHADPRLGIVLLPARGAGETDRRRHRLVARLGRRRTVRSACSRPGWSRPRSGA